MMKNMMNTSMVYLRKEVKDFLETIYARNLKRILLILLKTSNVRFMTFVRPPDMKVNELFNEYKR